MYKRVCLIGVLFLSLVFALPLISAAGSKYGPVPTPKAGVEMPKFMRVKVYFGKGTAGDSVVEAFMRGIRTMYPKINLRLIPGGSKAAVDRILANEADFGIGLGNFSYASWLGKKPFKKANTTAERFVYQIPCGLRITWVVRAGSDIHSVKDLDGKRINCAAPGTGANMSMIPGVLAGAGLSYESIKKNGGFIHVGPMGPAMDLLVSGQLDAVAVTEPQPSKSLNRYSLTHKLRLIPMTPQEQASGSHPETGNLAYGPISVPAGMYSWLTKDVPALGAMMSTNCRAALPKDVVYNLLCGTWSAWETWESIHPSFKGVDFPAEAMKSTPVPFHPGAEEFFKKWGFSLPTPLVFQK